MIELPGVADDPGSEVLYSLKLLKMNGCPSNNSIFILCPQSLTAFVSRLLVMGNEDTGYERVRCKWIAQNKISLL